MFVRYPCFQCKNHSFSKIEFSGSTLDHQLSRLVLIKQCGAHSLYIFRSVGTRSKPKSFMETLRLVLMMSQRCHENHDPYISLEKFPPNEYKHFFPDALLDSYLYIMTHTNGTTNDMLQVKVLELNNEK